MAALAALVASVASLIKVLPVLRSLNRRTAVIEQQVNGNLQREKDRNRELRDQLDELNTIVSHQRRTIEILIEKGTAQL